MVFRHPTLNVSCVDLRIAVLSDSAEGLVWYSSLWADSIWMCTLAEALSRQTNILSLDSNLRAKIASVQDDKDTCV